MKRPSGLRRLAALALVSTLVSVSPAYAEREVIRDASGDVLKTTFAGPGETTQVLDPTITAGDVRRTVVRHGAHRLNYRFKVRDLRRPDYVQILSQIKTSAADEFLLDVFRSPEGAWADLIIISDPNREDLRCRGIRTRQSVRRDLIRVSIPRRCLQRPRWVRVSATVTYTRADQLAVRWDDDVRMNGQVPPRWGPGSGRAFGPRLSAG